MSHYSTTCPNCDTKLYFSTSSRERIMCSHCKCLYEVDTFTVTNFSNIILHNDRGLPNGRRQFILEGVKNGISFTQSFSLFWPPKYLHFDRKDTVATFTLIKKSPSNNKPCVQILNLTRNFHYRFFKPDRLCFLTGLKLFSLIFMSSWLLTTLASHFQPRLKLLQIGILPVGIALSHNVYKRNLNSYTNKDLDNIKLMIFEQNIYSQIVSLSKKKDDLFNELIEENETFKRLSNLRQRMENSNSSLYQERIATIFSGENTIATHIFLGVDLYSDYEKVIEYLSIELETARLAERIPNLEDLKLHERLDALHELEVKKEEIKLTIDPKLLLL